MATVEDSFKYLCHHKITDIITTKEPATQLVALNLVKSVLSNLAANEIKIFLPSILGQSKHSSPLCREVVYSILFSLYENNKESIEEDSQSIYNDARDTLLRSVTDQDSELRNSILEFWASNGSSMSPADLILYVFREVHSPASDDTFLSTACHILMQASRSSHGYERLVYEQPITQCKFWEMRVSPAWQARHASMVPLFSSTQVYSGFEERNSLSSLVAMTQGDEAAAGMIAATQERQFTPTQTAPIEGSTPNTFIGTSVEAEEVNLVHLQDKVGRAPSQGSSGLVFSATSSGIGSHQHLYKKTGLGRSRMKPFVKGNEKDDDENNPKSASQLIRRRFIREQDREKQSIHFAKLEEKRRLTQQRLQLERKKRREAQVTMLREYRVGELPDIQIMHKSVIDPLSALAQKDLTVAQHVLVMITKGTLKNLSETANEGTLLWKKKMKDTLCSVIKDSVMCPPILIKSSLELLLQNNIICNPEAITHACISSGQESLGIILLEKLILDKQKKSKVSQPPKKRQKVSSETVDDELDGIEENKLFINLAELYGSISMWDVVRGILHGCSSSLHHFTKDALDAEAISQPKKAFEIYLKALVDENAENVPAEEQRVWEERFCSAAVQLGQWGKLETFVSQRFLLDSTTGETDLNNVWNHPRPTTVVLPALVNSKIVNLLTTPDAEGDIVEFINSCMQDREKSQLLEDNLATQIALLSVYQEKQETARVFLETARKNLFQSMSCMSVLSPKPLAPVLRSCQLIIEMEDFLNLGRAPADQSIKSSRIKKICQQWLHKLADARDDKFLIQAAALYRDLYSHLMEKEIVDESSLVELHRSQAHTHIAVAELALDGSNLSLAAQHIKKLESIVTAGHVDENFAVKHQMLLTHAAIVKSKQSDPKGSLKYLVEAWCRYLGKVDSMQSRNKILNADLEYLKWEARICQELCHTIQSLGDSYDSNNQYLKVLSSKFEDVKAQDGSQSWYPSLLECCFNDLTEITSKANLKKQVWEAYDCLAKFSAECLDKWDDYINQEKYQSTFVSCILKGMASGSSYAHFKFPRLIHMMDDNVNLCPVFQEHVDSVPSWMFLLWLPHILIYIDKNPGKALQSIILQLAHIYPQAVFYPFTVSKVGYDFESAIGKGAMSMCRKVESVLSSKCSILFHFLEAMLLVKEPFTEIKMNLDKILKCPSDGQKIAQLQSIYKEMFKESSFYSGTESVLNDSSLKGSGNEYGAQFKRIFSEAKKVFIAQFGENCSKLKSLKGKRLDNAIKELLKCWSNSVKDLKSCSPWLGNFQSSHMSEVLEIPGQYVGLKQPLPEYHAKISNFDNNLKVMRSIRKPIVITMFGTDEKSYKFLVKSGEDLRTDQRIEMMFTLMNNIYQNTDVTSQLSMKPHLTTFSVVPLSPKVGILQWVDNTLPLKDFIEESLEENEKAAYGSAAEKYYHISLDQLLTRKKDVCVKHYVEAVNVIPWDLLRRSLTNLSSGYESFFQLRSTFLSSHGALCISQWLLGIGDRHLMNFLFEFKTARMVGIDFGHHFESAIQFLPHPELMPFRMTPQIVNVSKPLGTNGLIKETMVSCLQALVDSKHVILSAIEAFAREPTQDWIDFVKRQEGSLSVEKIENYSAGRMEMISSKLNGANPCSIVYQTVKKNKRMDANKLKFLKNVVFGQDQLRSSFPTEGLSVPQQVESLLDLATDPDILGRTFQGWSSWI